MILTPRESNAFRRDKQRIHRSGYDLAKLDVVISKLAQREPLEHRLHDHSLTGNWNGYRECHIRPSWLLIYRIEGDELLLARTGSHSELF